LLFEKVALKSSEVEVQPKLNGGTDVNYVFEYALKETFSKKRLEKLSNDFSSQFQSNTPFPHVYIDNFVDPKLLKLIEQEVVEANYEGKCNIKGKKKKFACFYRSYKNGERNQSLKLGVFSEDQFGIFTRFMFLMLKSSSFTTFLEDISGLRDVIPDPHFRGSGLHSTAPGGFLRVHADFNLYEQYKLDRRINVFLFLNSKWEKNWGGALELWPVNMSSCEKKIQPIFNRLVIFKSTDFSFHGYTDPLTSPIPRRSMAMYYYTNGRPENEKLRGRDGSHSTLFQDVPCRMQSVDSLGPKCFKYSK